MRVVVVVIVIIVGVDVSRAIHIYDIKIHTRSRKEYSRENDYEGFRIRIL